MSNLLTVKIYSMVALRICVIVCASTVQFPNKGIKSTTDAFCSAQEGMPFIIVPGTVENVMRS